MAVDRDLVQALQQLRRIDEARRAAVPGSRERASADDQLDTLTRAIFVMAVDLREDTAATLPAAQPAVRRVRSGLPDDLDETHAVARALVLRRLRAMITTIERVVEANERLALRPDHAESARQLIAKARAELAALREQESPLLVGEWIERQTLGHPASVPSASSSPASG